MKKTPVLYIVLGVVVLVGLWMWTGYNGLITAKEAVDGSWAQVETQYQRRFDLVPNLVSTTKGAANFEQQTLQQVTEARTKWMSAGATRSDQIGAAQQLDGALGRLLVTVEAYPQLQSVQGFRDLMVQLEGTENRIATARRDYNMEVQSFNVRVKRFPANVLAGLFGFGAESFFDSQPGSENAPQVQFE